MQSVVILFVETHQMSAAEQADGVVAGLEHILGDR
jgi:hypothetical protein